MLLLPLLLEVNHSPFTYFLGPNKFLYQYIHKLRVAAGDEGEEVSKEEREEILFLVCMEMKVFVGMTYVDVP